MGWKIVRDNHQERAADWGISGSWRKANDPLPGLTKKLFEEAGEFAEHYDPGELYDLRDVVDELIFLTDSGGEYEALHEKKVNILGYFMDHVEWTPVPGELEGD